MILRACSTKFKYLSRKQFYSTENLFDYKKIYNSHVYLNFRDPEKVAKAYYLFPNFDLFFQPNLTPYEGTVEFESMNHGIIDMIDYSFCIHRQLAHIAYYEGRIIYNDSILKDYRIQANKNDKIGLLHYDIEKDILSLYSLKILNINLIADSISRKYVVSRNKSITIPLEEAKQKYPILWKNIQINKLHYKDNTTNNC